MIVLPQRGEEGAMMPKQVRLLIILHEIMWQLERLSGRILQRAWVEPRSADPPEWIRLPHSWFEGRRYDLQHMISRRGYDVYRQKI